MTEMWLSCFNGGVDWSRAMDYLLPDKTYHFLKWTGLIACPAVATFVGVVGPAWGMPHVDSIVTTINATGLLIGALIGASQVSAMGKPDRDWGDEL